MIGVPGDLRRCVVSQRDGQRAAAARDAGGLDGFPRGATVRADDDDGTLAERLRRGVNEFVGGVESRAQTLGLGVDKEPGRV